MRLKPCGIEDLPQHNNQLNKCCTLLGEALVRFIFGKDQRAGRDALHLHGCAWLFLEDLSKIYPQLKKDELAANWPAKEQAACLETARMKGSKKACLLYTSPSPRD